MRNLFSGLALMILAATFVNAADTSERSMDFSQITDRTDRVVYVSDTQALGERVAVTHPQTGHEVKMVLGFRDPATNEVFRSYRVTVNDCLYDKVTNDCLSEDVDIWVPGGIVWETHNGVEQLVSKSISGAIVAPESNTEYVLFLGRLNGGNTYYIVPDRNASLKVDHSSGTPRVNLRFGNYSLLSSAARQSSHNSRITDSRTRHSEPESREESTPASTGEFTRQDEKWKESVPLSEIKGLITKVQIQRQNRQ